MICHLYLSLLHNSDQSGVKYKHLNSKESYCLVLDVLAQTMLFLCDKVNNLHKEHEMMYKDIKRGYFICNRSLITNACPHKLVKSFYHDVTFYAIETIFKLFSSQKYYPEMTVRVCCKLVIG